MITIILTCLRLFATYLHFHIPISLLIDRCFVCGLFLQRWPRPMMPRWLQYWESMETTPPISHQISHLFYSWVILAWKLIELVVFSVWGLSQVIPLLLDRKSKRFILIQPTRPIDSVEYLDRKGITISKGDICSQQGISLINLNKKILSHFGLSPKAAENWMDMTVFIIRLFEVLV